MKEEREQFVAQSFKNGAWVLIAEGTRDECERAAEIVWARFGRATRVLSPGGAIHSEFET